jgi:hypothetical protein
MIFWDLEVSFMMVSLQVGVRLRPVVYVLKVSLQVDVQPQRGEVYALNVS